MFSFAINRYGAALRDFVIEMATGWRARTPSICCCR